MKKYLLNRLKEPSTMRAVVLVLTLFGVSLSPEQQDAIVVAGVSLIAALGLFLPDKIE